MPRIPESTGAMSFLDHLEELRSRLIRMLLVLMIVGFGGFFVADPVIQWLLYPLKLVHPPPKLIFLTAPRLFMVRFWVGMGAGIVVALPYIFYEVWAFLGPALFPREKRIALYLLGPSVLFFLMGLAFAFFVVIPMGLNFFLQVGALDIEAQLEIGEYIMFLLRLCLGFGLIFQLPVVVVVLTHFGIVGPELLLHYWRHAIVAILIVAMVLTPPDVMSQLLMAVPLIVLYFISIGASALVVRTRKRDG